ncbi:AraC family transcriptional regulator [Fulvivirgaceae bacterium PWU5]|uniref:AraC family transcriptional regulator n=1 Tax=Dawidia cretensis TaxID=2782350 RepID=A0AAP2GVX7_9BACT|nr:AraC family transcriptional regulator [Dawidia cretensis]MBT1711315.1 AraC family transcriptional regulator [Dawidia cretensis]
MERNHLIYDVPAVSSLPFRIINFRIHPDRNELLKIDLPEDFIGLYLNMGSAFEYASAKTTPGIFQHNQYNFIYLPSGEYGITVYAGLHHSLALLLPLQEIRRWSKDVPPLDVFLKNLPPGKSKFLAQAHTCISRKLRDELDRLLYSMWKDEYLRTLDIATASFNIFLQCISEITNVSLLPKGNPGNSEYRMVVDAAKFLTDNLGRNITVEELANKFNISRRNLQRGFQEHYGETVHEYILLYRMDQAKIFLLDRSRSIKSIAGLLGYKYVENFTTAYKKRFSQSPRDARALDQ